MRRLALLAAMFLLALQQRAQASPPGRLTWETGSIRAEVNGIGPVRIELACPGGNLRKVSVTIAEKSSLLPLEKFKSLKLPSTCSGLKTDLHLEDEGVGKPIGISLTLDFSSEYDRRELYLYFDFETRRFTIAKWQEQADSEPIKITSVPL